MPKVSAAPAILNAAEACLIEGDGAFEMRAVTNRVGVSEGLVYHYYTSKSGLMTAIVKRYYDRYSDVANRHVDRSVPWLDREEARLRAVVQFLYADPLTPIILGGLSRLPEAARVEMENRRTIAERSIYNIQSGQDQGVIPDWVNASIAGPATIGAMDQAVMHALSQVVPLPQHIVATEIWRIICAILAITD